VRVAQRRQADPDKCKAWDTSDAPPTKAAPIVGHGTFENIRTIAHVRVTRHRPGMSNTPTATAATTTPIDLRASVRAYEDALIRAALATTAGNKKAAAGLLGVKRTTLSEMVRRRGLAL
jgi:transcriptional regulator with GAF, ATPase, and Fis domain